MASLYLKINTPEVKKINLENIDLNDKVDFLKTKLNSQINNNLDCVFIHCGVILNENDSLIDAGISSGSVIHCLTKKEPALPIVLAPLELLKVQQLLVSIRTAINNSGFRAFIQKIRTPEMVEKIYKACPFVSEDPSALSFLQDAELFQSLSTPSELNKLIEERPVIGHLAQYLTGLITSEGSSRSHHVSYSLDALSDEEEEMDAEQSGESTAGSRASGSMSYQPITPGQLAAALANATGGGASRSSRSIPTTPSSSVNTPFNTPGPPSASGTLSSSGMITSEMFSQALQNALAASASRGSSSSSMPPTSNSGPGLENLEESLQLMREMGIGDEQMSLQALQASNGDVEAAVNIILTQLLADD